MIATKIRCVKCNRLALRRSNWVVFEGHLICPDCQGKIALEGGEKLAQHARAAAEEVDRAVEITEARGEDATTLRELAETSRQLARGWETEAARAQEREHGED